MTTDSWFWSQ